MSKFADKFDLTIFPNLALSVTIFPLYFLIDIYIFARFGLFRNMQHINTILALALIGYLKSVFGNLLPNENRSENTYKSSYPNDISKLKELLQSLNAENSENIADYTKDERTNMHSNDYDIIENKENNKLPQDGTYNDDAIRLLWNFYIDLLEKKTKSQYENQKHDDSSKFEKRALTMLTRWKPFRLNNLISGNGRHVIRSPLASRSDPNSFNRQVMGRPFRWG